MIDYKEYEKQVYSWLQEKHKKDASFTFSVRVKGSKGAESDYFVGTKRSNYFATTLWTIPVSFPGSSGDAISIIFGSKDNYFGYNFEFTQTKSPHDLQNKLALDLISSIKKSSIKKLGFSYESSDQNKTLTFKTAPRQSNCISLNAMLEDIDKDLETIVPIVDGVIAEIKKGDPEFVAHRITLPEFEKMQSNLEKRFLKYNALNVSSEDSKDINLHIDKKEELPTKENENPLNQILYGPPGTGKTFRLQDEYFEKFTVRESSLTRKQYLENMIADKTWWQVLSMTVLDLGNVTVNEIMEHELIKTKAALSNSKLPRTTIWGRLQAHTVGECKNVNVSDRSEPRMFFKDDDTKWSVDKNLLEDYYPEAISNLEDSKNFQPSSDKLIKNYEFVTFHQSFSYEDFVEGIKPKMEEQDTEVSYEIADGVFKKLALKAKADPDNNYAIFIDEINRGNVSAIFGELITLIEEDKRIGGDNSLSVKLPYSKKEFEVPSNLYVFGTMNTADRSVEALDTALRRRFSFKEIMPDPSLLEDKEFNGFNLEEVLKTINERIEFLLDRDHTIGHSYFMDLESDDTDGLEEVFKNKVIPLLQEYFYHDYEKIALILGSGFVTVKTNHQVKFPIMDGITSPDQVTLCELVNSIDDIEAAVLKLLNRDGE